MVAPPPGRGNGARSTHPPKGVSRPIRSPQEALNPLGTGELVRLLMVTFQYEFTSLRLRILGCTLDDLRTELRRREGMGEEAAR